MFQKLLSLLTVRIPDTSGRTWGLDLIRAIAILDVVKIHMTQLIFSRYGFDVPDMWPLRGVQLFFVLSGFLIGSIIIRETERKGWSVPSMFRFLTRRWMRTLPNYYAILLTNILVQYLLHGQEGLAHFSFSLFFFTYNLFTIMPAFFMEAWTISIEEWFYLLYAVMAVALYGFLNHSRHIKPISLSIALLMIVVTTALRYTPYYQATSDLKMAVAFRIDGIAYGVVGAWFYYYYRDLWQSGRWVMLAAGAALLFLVKLQASPFQVAFSLGILSLGYILCFPVFHSIKRVPPVLGYIVQAISQLSYSMYLLNLSIVGGLTVYLFPDGRGTSVFLISSFYLVFLWLMSVIFYKCVERPVLDLRDKYYP